MRAVLIDFSIAASLDDAVALRACAGTPGQRLATSSAASAIALARVSASVLHAGYVAPEIIEGLPYDEGVDVFSAGVLWQLVCTDPTSSTSINSASLELHSASRSCSGLCFCQGACPSLAKGRRLCCQAFT